MDIINKIDTVLDENTKRYYMTDNKHHRIGLIHFIHTGEKTIYVDEDVSNGDKQKIIKEFEKLEDEVYDFIEIKEKEFNSFLEKNNFHSGMGSIGYKQKE